MTISSERLVRHMIWANQRVFAAVQTLPDQALDSFIVNSEWTARHILQHIVSGADWFSYRLTNADWSDIKLPQTMSDVAPLAKQLDRLDRVVLSASHEPDAEISQSIEGKEVTRLRSTMVSQAIHHATEHRAQLIDALEFRGYKPINLDDIDLWHFEDFERTHR